MILVQQNIFMVDKKTPLLFLNTLETCLLPHLTLKTDEVYHVWGSNPDDVIMMSSGLPPLVIRLFINRKQLEFEDEDI